MNRLPASLLLCALLSACASGSLHDDSAAARAADAAQAQALTATAPPEGQPLAPWLDAQRARIAAERDVATQRYEATEKACWQRFAVNDCLRQARTERRAVLDRLRQQELAVNDLDRRRRADERLRQLERKQSGSDG